MADSTIVTVGEIIATSNDVYNKIMWNGGEKGEKV